MASYGLTILPPEKTGFASGYGSGMQSSIDNENLYKQALNQKKVQSQYDKEKSSRETMQNELAVQEALKGIKDSGQTPKYSAHGSDVNVTSEEDPSIKLSRDMDKFKQEKRFENSLKADPVEEYREKKNIDQGFETSNLSRDLAKYSAEEKIKYKYEKQAATDKAVAEDQQRKDAISGLGEDFGPEEATIGNVKYSLRNNPVKMKDDILSAIVTGKDINKFGGQMGVPQGQEGVPVAGQGFALPGKEGGEGLPGSTVPYEEMIKQMLLEKNMPGVKKEQASRKFFDIPQEKPASFNDDVADVMSGNGSWDDLIRKYPSKIGQINKVRIGLDQAQVGSETPAAETPGATSKYRAGDTRIIGGKLLVRDEKGEWKPK